MISKRFKSDPIANELWPANELRFVNEPFISGDTRKPPLRTSEQSSDGLPPDEANNSEGERESEKNKKTISIARHIEMPRFGADFGAPATMRLLTAVLTARLTGQK